MSLRGVFTRVAIASTRIWLACSRVEATTDSHACAGTEAHSIGVNQRHADGSAETLRRAQGIL
jgi:hypothetical protein